MTFPYLTGAIPSPVDTHDYPVARRLVGALPLPAAFRLSKLPVVTEQTDASCVKHAMAGVAGYDEIHEAGTTSRFDAEAWYQEDRIPGVDGLIVRDSLQSWRVQGPPMAFGDRAHYRINAFYAVPGLEEIKQVIYQQRHPVLLVSNIATAWGTTSAAGQLDEIEQYQPQDQWTNTTHLWWAWGWDDRATLGLLIRSSWGTSFGKNGNCYMTPHQFDASFVEAWYVESAK
jgi:hypothetical protein